VVAGLQDVADVDLHIAAVTIGELQTGVELTREQDRGRAAEIEAWVEQVADSYNVLPMDARIFRAWARLMHRQSRALLEDAMIAATAEVHGLIVVTRCVISPGWGCRRAIRSGICGKRAAEHKLVLPAR
jgi:predicted nucleic acid-binding protein